jgi:hypothetical protein
MRAIGGGRQEEEDARHAPRQMRSSIEM